MIYILIFVFLSLLAFLTWLKLPRALNIVIFFIASIVLILFVGLRGNIDPDYGNYLSIFNHSDLNYGKNSDVEFGYYLLNKVVLFFGLPFQSIIILMAAVGIFLKLVFFYKASPNYGLSLFIYFCTVFFLFDFIAIRQAVALGLFMISIPFLFERKLIPYFLLLLVACQIHISAILLIPGYYLFSRKFSNWTLGTVVAICAVINLLKIKVGLIQILLALIPIPAFTAAKLLVYLSATEYAFVSVKQIILASLFITLNRARNDSHESKLVNVLVNLFVFGILFATLFNGLPELSYRMKWYFFWPESILMVYLIRGIAKEDLKLTFGLYLTLIVIYGYSLYNFLSEIASRGDYIFPYKLFFQ